MRKYSLYLLFITILWGCNKCESFEVTSVEEVETNLIPTELGRIKLTVMVHKKNGERLYVDAVMPQDKFVLMVAKEHNVLQKITGTVWIYSDHQNIERIKIRE